MIAQYSSSGAGAIFFLLPLAVFALLLIAWVRIITKAGFSGWWVLIAFVPIANVVMLFVFAFSDWPALARDHPAPGSGPSPDDRGLGGSGTLPPPPPAP